MNERQRLIGIGVYDRLLNVLAQVKDSQGHYLTGELRTDSPSVIRAINRLRSELGLTGRGTVNAYRSLADEARKAVNAARRYNNSPGTEPTPGVSGLPCPDQPGGRCEGYIEYSGWVVIHDPASGVTTRVPFVFNSGDPLNLQQITTRASTLASNDLVTRGYDKGGRVDPGTAVVTQVILGSITGRE